jgi:hypothetical protein
MSPDTDVTVVRKNFNEQSVVLWNGESRASWNGKYRQTQYLAPTMVNVKVLTSDLVKPGKVNVTVVSPGPGGGESGELAFAVVR